QTPPVRGVCVIWTLHQLRRTAIAVDQAIHPRESQRARPVDFDSRSIPFAPWLSTIAVAVAAALPYLSTIRSYFIADDFGLIQLFSSKPTFHFLTLFTSPWTETIYGSRTDELRPFVELSYQFDSLLGSGNPVGYHIDTIVLHALN